MGGSDVAVVDISLFLSDGRLGPDPCNLVPLVAPSVFIPSLLTKWVVGKWQGRDDMAVIRVPSLICDVRLGVGPCNLGYPLCAFPSPLIRRGGMADRREVVWTFGERPILM